MGQTELIVDGNAPQTRRPRRGRLWLFRCGALVLIIGTIELVSFLTWCLHPPINRSQLAARQQAVATLGTERTSDLEVLHPYLGWVFNPDAAQLPAHSQEQVTVNSLGFADTASSIRKRSPDRVVIGILGGSVAQQMSTIGEQAFRNRLEASPALKGRKIEIVRLAMSGYKQPQQAMALNYVLALGGEFDVVVNVDGYNETGLVVGENHEHRVFAAYPRGWHARLQDVVDPRNSAVSYQLLKIRSTRQAWADWIIRSPLGRTSTVSLVWAARDESLRNQQVALGLELVARTRERGHGFARQGPSQMYQTAEEMYDHIAMIWKNSSLQMHHLCSGRGIEYLHVLQPNQYHEGSKTLSARERQLYYSPNEPHSQAAKQGYPKLIRYGESMKEQGVNFHDLTMLFAEETDTIYNDYFCHYNERGTNLLAEAVADRVLEKLSTR